MDDNWSRRSVLRTSGLLVGGLSGCVAKITERRRNKTGTENEHTGTTAKRQRCSETSLRKPTPSVSDDEVRPKSYPEIPTQLSEASVLEFAISYEKSYMWNQILIENESVELIDIQIEEAYQESKAVKRSTGYLATFTMKLGYGTKNSDADEYYPAAYFVSQDLIRRGELSEDEKIDVASFGTVIRCSK